jgi:hypothetical protein
MSRFDPRMNNYVNGIKTNYRSQFQADCQNDYDKETDNDYPPSYNRDSNESPEDMEDYNNKPARRTRPSYPSKVNVVACINQASDFQLFFYNGWTSAVFPP